MVFAFWTLVVLVYSTRTDLAGAAATWGDALRASMAQWYVWALLTPLIVFVDGRLPVRRDSLVRRLLLHAPLFLVFAVAHEYLSAAAGSLLAVPVGPRPDGLLATLQLATRPNGLVYWAIVGVHVAFEYQTHLQDRQLRTAELEKHLAESRFQALRTQFQPYLLSKALNAIASHVEGDPRTARLMLEQIGSLIRLAQEHAQDPEVPLERELAFVDAYLAVQQARLVNQLEVTTAIVPAVRRALVPTFILHPLVDNAIRHHTLSSGGGVARIHIEATLQDGQVRLSVCDNGPGLPDGWDPESGFGEGLSGTRDRLRRLYGDDQSLTLARNDGPGVTVAVTLPFVQAEPARVRTSGSYAGA